MNKVRVEVFYQDNALQSIRIDKCEMEGLTAIENKPIPEWFMPVSGRASWKGLGEEVKPRHGMQGLIPNTATISTAQICQKCVCLLCAAVRSW